MLEIRNSVLRRTGGVSRPAGLIIGLAAAGLVVLAIAGFVSGTTPAGDLERLEQKIALTFPTVGRITTAELQAGLSRKPRAMVVLDARKPAEYAVSHISGAVRVSPDVGSRAPDWLDRAAVAGRDVIVYCSVGFRSSRVAKRLAAALRHRGARRVLSLSGGLFKWHNQKRPLEANGRSTDAVHPYSRGWEGYLSRSEKISYGVDRK